MSTKLIKVGNSFNVPQKTYICNTEEERDNLKAYFGDLCLVIDDGITYILNSEGDWYPYPTGGGGGGDVSSDTIAPLYEPTKTAYAQNELIMYDSQLYRAKQAIAAPAGDFDSTKWEKVDIASTKADLVNGKVPVAQLPSYVDDVIEGYYNEGIFYSDSTFETPIVGEAGKIYVDLLTNSSYRWSGSTYIQVNSGGGGETVNALDTEEMMELFADTGLTETAGVEYVEYTEDPNGDYVYDEELGEYRLYEEGDTGTRYSADAGPAGYVEYVEDENGAYVWDEELQVYRLYEEGDTGTRYSIGETYILIY